MKKNQNGVTLIALAVTIIVMLILAGATMATLNGENGILTQSRKASAANTEASVKEKMNTSYTAVALEVQMESAANPAYSAQANIKHYLQVIADQIGKAESYELIDTEVTALKTVDQLTKGKYTIYYKGSVIYIDYADATFNKEVDYGYKSQSGSMVRDESVKIPTNKNEYPMLRYSITFDTNTTTPNGPRTNALSSN